MNSPNEEGGAATGNEAITGKPNAIVAILLNFCCFFLGHLYAGQVKKGIMVAVVGILASLVTFFVGGLGGLIVWVLGVVDLYQVCDAVGKGETVGQNEYKLEPLHKLMAFVDKSAVFRG